MKLLPLTVVLVASTALAGNKDKADALFKQGKKLMNEKKFSDACEAFEQSMKLDPGIGTELNIARCYEEWGKLGRALRAYQTADKMAKDAKDSRADKIDGLVTELDSQVPRLTIHAAKATGITLDGVAIEAVGEPLIVDPGPHTIVYPTPAGPKTKIVAVERGAGSEVTLEGPPVEERAHPVADEPVDHEPKVTAKPATDPGHGYRVAAYAVGGVGVAAIAVSSYLTVSARGKYNDALKAHCGGQTNGCDDIGLKDTHDARHRANIATIVFSAGLAALGGGIVFYVLAPKGNPVEKPEDAALYVVPSFGADGAGLVVGGHL